MRTAAAARGVNLADGLAFFPDGDGTRFLRLPFCALTPEQIDEGILRLAASVAAVRSMSVLLAAGSATISILGERIVRVAVQPALTRFRGGDDRMGG